ncbi:hypothetical protein ABPG74_011969 [Tetrahymena malaccensis]
MASSNFNQNFTPFCHKWDQAFVSNYSKFESEVNSIEKKLENKKLSSRYPFFFQRSIINLELNKQMLQLGQIFDEEYERYEKFNQNIRTDFKSVFQSKFQPPFLGITVSAGLFGIFAFVPYFKKISSIKYSVLAFPPVIEYLYDHANTGAQFRTKEFLNWVLAFREGQSRLEFEGKMLFEKNPRLLKRFRHFTLNRTSPYDIYEKMVLLIREEYPENDTGNITSFV